MPHPDKWRIMSINFESARNYQETLVFDRVQEWASKYPQFAMNEDMLVDAACLALNMLKPRYIRYSIDMMFHISNAERAQEAAVLDAAVAEAFKIVAAGRRKVAR
jgi:hypothetical protein